MSQNENERENNEVKGLTVSVVPLRTLRNYDRLRRA